MKIFQKGFTLAELLLVIAIIGIVSAMGASITKKTTEKAYNLFYYTGYINLYDAISDTAANTGSREENRIGGGTCDIDINTPVCHINNLLGTTAFNNAFPFQVITRNGIIYEFTQNSAMSVTMGVPSPKTRNNPDAIVYVPLRANVASGTLSERTLLVPIDPNLLPNGVLNNRTYIALGNRRDLLPVHLDNGLTGRVRSNINGGGSQHTPNLYYSYNQAVCSYLSGQHNLNSVTDMNGTIILNCNNIQGIPQYNNGVPKFSDPIKSK